MNVDERVREVWRRDAEVLHALLAGWRDSVTVEVEIPPDLAERAVAAWERDEPEDGAHGAVTIEDEPEAAARERQAAAALALIGLRIERDGRRSGDGDIVQVALPMRLIEDIVRATAEE